MTITRVAPPFNYLYTASQSSLQSFELAHLNHAANLRREIATLIDQWIEETAEAMLARSVLDHYASLHPSALPGADNRCGFQNPVADLLSGALEPPTDGVGAPPRFAKTLAPKTVTIGRKGPL